MGRVTAALASVSERINMPSLFSRIHPSPLGLLYIAAYLKKHGHAVSVVDLRRKPLSRSMFLARVRREKPRIVGISIMTETYHLALQIARTVKEWNPAAWVVAGGPHVTFMDEEALRAGPIDIVVRNEGEQTMLDLAGALLDGGMDSIGGIKGISYAVPRKHGRTVTRTASRPPMADLDELPFPARDLVDAADTPDSDIMITGRGCPYGCIFCAASAMSGKKRRYRSVESVIEEMHLLHETLGIPTIYVVDDTIGDRPERVKRICRRLIADRFAGTWTCEMRVNEASPELLQLIRNAGCDFLQFGLESGDDAVLKAIRKRITVERIERAVSLAREIGFKIKCSAIIGHHADTHESIRETIDFLVKLKEKYDAGIALSINTPLPGTYLYNHAAELGVRMHGSDWADYVFDRASISTKHLSRTDIQTMYFLAVLETNRFGASLLPSAARAYPNEALARFMAERYLQREPSAHPPSPWEEDEH